MPIHHWPTLSNGICWALTSCAIVFFALRLWCKARLLGSFPRHDDLILFASVAVTVIGASCMSRLWATGAHARGHRTASDARNEHLLVSVCSLAAAWSKTAFAATLWAITPRAGRWGLAAAVGLLNAVMLLNALNSWVRTCGQTGAEFDLFLGEGCWSLEKGIAVTYAAAAYSGFLDLVFALWPWFIILRLKKMSRAEKIGTGVAMSLGILAFAVVPVRFLALEGILGRTYASQFVFPITNIAEPALSIIAQCIPVFRVLLRGPREVIDSENTKAQTLDTGRRIIEQENDSFRLELFVTPGGRVLAKSEAESEKVTEV